VALRPQQEVNKALDKKRNILLAAGLMQPGQAVDIEALYASSIRPKVVVLATGEYDENTDPNTFDERQAAKNKGTAVSILPEKDIARIRVHADRTVVYEVYAQDQLKTIVLPVHGKGLWSTLWGFLALEADAKTIAGIGFYEHAETPGLGGEVDNPAWKSTWQGKKLTDDEGAYKFKVLKGKVNQDNPLAVYQVDGLSGSTLTTNGVDALVRYWVSDEGLGRYLSRIRQGRAING
jgi:Na+-transporting NADH:ubiquinone oxidoreductase subunit C